MHLSGRAVDIRTRDKTQEQLDLMIQVVNDMGDRPLYEPVPPHLDISLRNDYTLPGQPGSTDKKKGLNRLVLLGIVGALIWMN